MGALLISTSISQNQLFHAYCGLYTVFIFIAIVNGLSIYTQRWRDLLSYESRIAPHECCIEGQDMQKSSTGCGLLIIVPAFFILLQVALSLYLHRSEPHHGDKFLPHLLPAAFAADLVKQDIYICLATKLLLSPSSCIWGCDPDSPEVPVTTLITDPPQSRAPPTSFFS